MRRKLICVNRGLLVMNNSMSTFWLQLMDDIQRFRLYCWKETIKSDSLNIRFLGKVFILNRRNICSFLMNSRFFLHLYSNQPRIAFRIPARLVCHLVYFVFSFGLFWSNSGMNSKLIFLSIFFIFYYFRSFQCNSWKNS